MSDACRIRPMTAADLDRVLTWRNHPDVRRYMLTQHEIAVEEHRQWFQRASADASRALLIVEELGLALGFVHFSGVAPGAVSDWGFYAAPDAAQGSGTKLGVTAINFAFLELKLHKICGQALDFNEASIRFHRKLGFQQEGILREQHRIGDAHHDLICFGLLHQEWRIAQSI